MTQVASKPYQTTQFLSDVLFDVFPNGTLPREDAHSRSRSPWRWWQRSPFYAADLFAFCAQLINHTGAMGYLDPQLDVTRHDRGRFPRIGIMREHENCLRAAQEWRRGNNVPAYVQAHWNVIILAAQRGEVASVTYYSGKRNPEMQEPHTPFWWESMFCLLIIADEACDRLGHFVFDKLGRIILSANQEPITERLLNGRRTVNFRNNLPDAHLQTAKLTDKHERWDEVAGLDGQRAIRAKRNHSSLTVMANPAVIAVQPKGRVTAVGCSIRNLTRNLAAVGPVGAVRCNWQQLPASCSTNDYDSLNLLLIPIPYNLRATDFSADPERGEFEINQRWLDDAHFVPKLIDLVARASLEGEIHGIILPELAVNHAIFERLLKDLFIATGNRLKFIITGSSTDCNDEHDNMVLTAVWENNSTRQADEPEFDNVRYFSQRKHQRWRIDKSQIKNYALGSSLSTSTSWWEKHEIGRRELHFFQLRSNTVFASLICEDMARNDPCHDIVRSVAPNLVFALLMDGPQLPSRWPGRYAGSLADDPGCTVLSFTSYALIGRSNDQSPDRTSNAVGLLRDSTGASHEIMLPRGKDAIIVSLSSLEAKDKTIDGRHTRYASRWKFINQMPISVGIRDRTWEKPKPKLYKPFSPRQRRR